MNPAPSMPLAIHDAYASADLPVWCGGMPESGIGRAYNVAPTSLPNFSMPGDRSPCGRYREGDVVRPEWTMDANSMFREPLDRAGLGVTVDVDRADDLTVRQDVLDASGVRIR